MESVWLKVSGTPENVTNSFELTEVPFGIPNYLPIGFLGVVVGIDRLKKRKKTKSKFIN
ncbi:MAG: hypothetical protein GDA44_14745 [Prochloron sp. SP5CPC1]|nr:hypothetical protein [Candidatus Paraprochloron terpiosi SP5CPC1]